VWRVDRLGVVGVVVVADVVVVFVVTVVAVVLVVVAVVAVDLVVSFFRASSSLSVGTGTCTLFLDSTGIAAVAASNILVPCL
jgi:hypothetical protein